MAMVFSADTADTPLCPAGHLPHKGGDRIWHDLPVTTAVSLAARVTSFNRAMAIPRVDLPTRGGDARQGKAGRARHTGYFLRGPNS